MQNDIFMVLKLVKSLLFYQMTIILLLHWKFRIVLHVILNEFRLVAAILTFSKKSIFPLVLHAILSGISLSIAGILNE